MQITTDQSGLASPAAPAALSWGATPTSVAVEDGSFTVEVARTGVATAAASATLQVASSSTAVAGTNYTSIGTVALSWAANETATKTQSVTVATVGAGDTVLTFELVSASGVAVPADLDVVLVDPVAGLTIAASGSADLSGGFEADGAELEGDVFLYVAEGTPNLRMLQEFDTIDWYYGDGTLPSEGTLDTYDDTSTEWVRQDTLFQGLLDGAPRAWATASHAPYTDAYDGGVGGGGDGGVGNLPSEATGTIYTHISAAQIATARARLGSSPWSSYKTEHDANVAAGMATDLLSVIDNGGDASNPRRWTTDAAYIPGGEVYDPTASRYDYVGVGVALSKLCNALAMAWHLEDDTAAAQKCVDLLYHHLGNPATSVDFRVKAAGTLSRNVEIYNTHVGIFRALGLVWGFDQWTELQRSQVLTALQQFLVTHRPYDAGGVTDENNIDIWRMAARSTAAAILGDTGAIQEEVDWFKSRITRLQRADGLWSAEQARDRGVFYTLYACTASCMFGLVVDEHTSNNLMNWTSGGRGIRPGLDAMVPYVDVANPRATWEATGRSETEENGAMDKTTMNLECYEIGWSKWADADYSSIITRWGRPIGNKYSEYTWTFYAGATI